METKYLLLKRRFVLRNPATFVRGNNSNSIFPTDKLTGNFPVLELYWERTEVLLDLFS